MAHDPHAALTVATTLAIGWLMMWAGMKKSALELRRRRRICPSCGRHIQARVCSCGSV